MQTIEKFWGLVLSAVMIAPLSAVMAASGTDDGSFLTIPVGARPAAMGSAYSALASDAYAPIYNPGGLGFVDRLEVAAQHITYLDSLHYEYAGAVYPFREGQTLGVSAQYIGAGDFDGLDENANPTGTYSSHYAAYGLSYGYAWNNRWGIGGSAKLIDAALSDVSATAFAADAGVMFRPTSRWSFAGVMSNAGSSLTFLNDPGSLPLTFNLGTAYVPVPWLTLALDGSIRRSGPSGAHVGVEWKPLSLIALRAGYRSESRNELGGAAGMTTGFGIQAWGQELAFAWLPYGDLGSTEYFSWVGKFAIGGHSNMENFSTP